MLNTFPELATSLSQWFVEIQETPLFSSLVQFGFVCPSDHLCTNPALILFLTTSLAKNFSYFACVYPILTLESLTIILPAVHILLLFWLSGSGTLAWIKVLRLREGTRCRPGWMQNCCLFRLSSEARLSEMHRSKSQGKRVVIRIINQNQESELQIKQTRARQNRNQYQRVVVYNFWLTSNRHRIKINVLTEDRQTDWSIYKLGY